MMGGYMRSVRFLAILLSLGCATARKKPAEPEAPPEPAPAPTLVDVNLDPYDKIPVSGGCPPRKKFPAPPTLSTSLNGVALPELCFDGVMSSHVFAMGDYGGITCGDAVTMGKRDPNGWTCKRNAGVYVRCADNTNDHPERGRFKFPVDAKPQHIVATQMQKRYQLTKPLYALNAGDNFYFGGLDVKCNQPMTEIHPRTRLQFKHVFEDMYAGIDVPFLSVLGNHDYGGRHFDSAFDQQMVYTWASNTTSRWIMPAFFYKQTVTYPTGNFTVDYFMVDTNKGDAKPFGADTKHNICGGFNSPSANCARAGGPDNRMTCPRWFDKLWKDQAAWLETELNASTADWQIIVTHFPPDQFMSQYWTRLHKKYGIDLFVASHRHTEEVHINDRRFAGLSWIVVGGGGGITSEWNPDGSKRGRDQYGFMDLEISKEEMKIYAINEVGDLRSMNSIAPHLGQVQKDRLNTGPTIPTEHDIVPDDAHTYAIPTAEFLMMEETSAKSAALAQPGASEMKQLSAQQVGVEALEQAQATQEDYMPAEDAVADSNDAFDEIAETFTGGSATAPAEDNSFHWYSALIALGSLSIAGGVVLLISENMCGKKRKLRRELTSRSSLDDY